jgi:hypothetical protein
MLKRGIRHNSPLDKSIAIGSDYQEVFVNSIVLVRIGLRFYTKDVVDI